MNGTSDSVRLPLGVRDFLPLAAARRRSIGERCLSAFERWGYRRILAPAFEYEDVLARGLGHDVHSAAIRFVEPLTGEVVALPTDITPQVARMAATRLGDVGGPLRLCYDASVVRLNPGDRGQRQVLQAGVELIGIDSPEGDAEALAVAADTLAGVRCDFVRLDVGHVALARAAMAGIDDPAHLRELREVLGKKDRSSIARVARGLPPLQRKLLEALPLLFGEPEAVLAQARELRLPAVARKALDNVEHVLDLARDVVDEELFSNISLDLGEIRGFEYYTGLRFAGYGAGMGEALLRGGRYDELMARYGAPAPATGFAVDIECIAEVEAGATAGLTLEPAVLLSPVKDQRRFANKVAAALRAGGLRVAVDSGKRRSAAAMAAYAADAGFTAVLSIDADGKGQIQAVRAPVAGSQGTDKSAPTAIGVRAIRRAARGDATDLLAGLERSKQLQGAR